MTYVFNNRIELTLTVTSLGKKRGRVAIVVPRETSPDIFELVLTAARCPGAEVDTDGVDRKVLRKLIELGLVVRNGDQAPDVRFVNALRSLGRAAEGDEAPPRLSRNRRVWLQSTPAPPAGLHRLQHFGAFDLTKPLLWVEEPVTRFVHPVQVDPRDLSVVAELLEKGTLDAKARTLRLALWRAGVLVEPAVVRAQRAARARALVEAKASLKRAKYAVLRGVVPPVFRQAAQAYLRRLDKGGYLSRDGDDHEPNRHWQHNEPLNRFIQFQLATMLRRVVPQPIKPSFAYLSIYRPGARLVRHTDRRQCLWNMSVQLDSEPSEARSKPWPLFLEIDGDARRVDLDLGDSVVYSGTDIPHWRPYLPRGRSASTVCSYHFVDAAFRGTLE